MHIEKTSINKGYIELKPQSFKQTNPNTPLDSPVHKQKSKAAKIMLGATIAAGIAAAGIAVYKGRLNFKNILNKKQLKTAQKLDKNILKKTQNTVEIKDIKSDTSISKPACDRPEPTIISKEKLDTNAAKPALEKVKAAETTQTNTASNINIIDWNSPLYFKKGVLGGNSFYAEDFLQKLNEKPALLNLLKELENVTFDTPNLKIMKDFYDKQNFYDLGVRYAIIANNTAKQKGFGAIIAEVPDMFKGLDIKDVVKKIDDLASLLDYKKVNKFTISGREYRAELIGSGCLSDVYKITYPKTGEKVCIKFARQPYLTGRGQGVFDETAITCEANKAGVVDVPKLYMANPIGRYLTLPNTLITNNGAWQMSEFIEAGKKAPSDGLKLLNWLKSKGLYHGDCHSGNFVGDIIVDLGGILDEAHTIVKFADLEPLLRGYQNGLSTGDMLKNYSKAFTRQH